MLYHVQLPNCVCDHCVTGGAKARVSLFNLIGCVDAS